MKKRLLLLLAGGMCAGILLLPGCGKGEAKPEELAASNSALPQSTTDVQSAASSNTSSSEDLTGNAKDIEKMLQGIQNDSTQISISQGDSTTDSLTSQINSYLSDSNDQIGSINK